MSAEAQRVEAEAIPITAAFAIGKQDTGLTLAAGQNSGIR